MPAAGKLSVGIACRQPPSNYTTVTGKRGIEYVIASEVFVAVMVACLPVDR